jgi:Flp pilus assembly secretin CpaC
MTTRIRLGTTLLLLVAIAATLAPPAGAAGVVEDRGTLRATVGGGQVLTFSSPVRRIAVANESLAAVHLVSEREVLLNGVSPGVTTLFIWLDDDRRVRYVLRVGPNVDYIAQALRDLDPRISVEPSPDGSSIVLRGDVADARTARTAKEHAWMLLGGARNEGVGTILNLLRYPGMTATAEDRIAAALESIDPRIRVRRIQVGAEPDPEKDSFVLEGSVRSVSDLQRAVTLAERQLGGTGLRLKVADEDRVQFSRSRGGFGGFGGGVGGQGGLGIGLLGGGGAPLSSSLASKISRGLVVTSESGRVVSFLEVDQIDQVMVSIRVFEVDRGKARKLGINFRIDREHVSIGAYTGPQTPGGLPGQLGQQPSVSGLGVLGGANLVGAFVDSVQSILTAIDFLDSKNLVRSVAEPNVLTLSGEEATVLVGGEVPIPTTAANQVSTFQGVFFQDFGVRLDIRPTVDRHGVVTLEVAPSIVRPDAGLAVSQIPGFQVQTVETTARVEAGQSLVLGGLISFEEAIEQRGLPGLQKIPLFRWKNRTHQEKELLFVITPQLVGYSSAAAAEAEVGPLAWPEERDDWTDDLPALRYEQDGVPPSFAPAPEPAVVEPTPMPVPMPVPSQPEPPPSAQLAPSPEPAPPVAASAPAFAAAAGPAAPPARPMSAPEPAPVPLQPVTRAQAIQEENLAPAPVPLRWVPLEETSGGEPDDDDG